MSRRGDGSEGEGENPFYMQAVRQQFKRMNVVCNGIIDRLERLEQRDRQNERRPNRRDLVTPVVESDEDEVDNYNFEVERPRRDRYERRAEDRRNGDRRIRRGERERNRVDDNIKSIKMSIPFIRCVSRMGKEGRSCL